uniref:non-specific serine/threonine protein kinase n=1 Tax=Brassica oleracea var. oleracea TaxID=109376 RepID=A0A0D3AMR6_BRAOL
VQVFVCSCQRFIVPFGSCKPKIIHRDIKAANILIGDSYEAKVADYGLTRSTLDSDSHISTRIMGTFGYLTPDYATFGQLSEKADVLSFRVVLLELITGRKPLAKPLIVQSLKDGNFDGLVDPRLADSLDANEMMRMVSCAAASVRVLRFAGHSPGPGQAAVHFTREGFTWTGSNPVPLWCPEEVG